MSELSDKIKDSGIEITSTHKGFDEETLNDKWSCKITYEGRSATFSYFTGKGLRKIPSYIKREGNQYWDPHCHYYRSEVNMASRNISLTVDPELADVLHCLLSDSGAIGEAFIDWCDNLGYDTDIRSYLDTYLHCQENGVKLRKVLGYKLMSELSQLEH